MITVVGYDDLYPITIPGRLTQALACIVGVISISLIIASVSSLFIMEFPETKSYLLINKLMSHEKCKRESIDSLYKWLQIAGIRDSVEEQKDFSLKTEKSVMLQSKKDDQLIFSMKRSLKDLRECKQYLKVT
jgi:hypothetical protein